MKPSRREFFQTMGTGAASLAIGAGIMSSGCTRPSGETREEKDGPVLQIGDNIALANTIYGKDLLQWPGYTAAKGETMILDDVCEVKNDPDREARKALPVL